MPQRKLSPVGAIATIGTFKNFVDLLREMSFEEEREQAERMPRILVIAPSDEIGRKIGDLVTGVSNSAAVSIWPLDSSGRDSAAFDIVIVNDPSSNASFRTARDRAGFDGMRVLDLSLRTIEDGPWVPIFRQRIAAAVPNSAPALGRWFPEFRPAATKAVIDETSRVNAQFAVVANVPSVIPIIGSIASAGADFFVLTKNQVMMVYKLAAINGRDLNDQWGIIREMLPVVGAGFLWRTLAREATSFLPFMAGTVPKLAIAYTGTLAAGRAADFYYRFGKKPDREQLREFYAQASESFKRLPLPISKVSGNSIKTPTPGPSVDTAADQSVPPG
jgi:uncharacterized protein (DUF697 family)